MGRRKILLITCFRVVRCGLENITGSVSPPQSREMIEHRLYFRASCWKLCQSMREFGTIIQVCNADLNPLEDVTLKTQGDNKVIYNKGSFPNISKSKDTVRFNNKKET